MGNLLYFIIIGLLAGALAKMLMPGGDKEPKGCLLTMLLGMVGAILMGFIADLLMGGGRGGFIPSLVGATLGAMIVIFLFRKLVPDNKSI